MKTMELLADLLKAHPASGISHTKTWSNIANALATVIVAKLYLFDGHSDSEMLVLYLAIVGAHSVASKTLNRRRTDPQPAPSTTQPGG